jgi:hypothetical protein
VADPSTQKIDNQVKKSFQGAEWQEKLKTKKRLPGFTKIALRKTASDDLDDSQQGASGGGSELGKRSITQISEGD